MRLSKILAVVLIVSVLALSLSGCARVTLSNEFYRNTVKQTIEIVITEDNESLYGYSRDDILNIIEQVFKDFGRDVQRDGNKIVGTITFSSRSELAADAVGYGYTATAPVTVLQGFFFSKYVSICQCRFSDTENWELVNKLLDTYFSEAANFDAEALEYVYKYSTVYDSVTTNGETTKEGSLNVHTWNIESDTVLQIEQTRENAAVWYAVAVVAALALATALLIVSQHTKKSNKNNLEK